MDVNESHAYHIALKTLRERCHYLQHKLEASEEENYKLKLQLAQESTSRSPKTAPDVHLLNEEIALLSKQKSQLSHQIQMVSAENHTLWSRLSKLSAANQNLGSRLCMITDTLNRHEASVIASVTDIDSDTCKNLKSPECSKESLEEISLKLINGILLEKTELENQYAQMVDLQNDNESVDLQNYCFSLNEEDDSSILANINKHVQKLNQFKQLLYHQKSELSSAITNFKTVKKSYVCNNCVNNVTLHCEIVNNSSISGTSVPVDNRSVESGNDLSTLRVEQSIEVNEVDNQNSEKICPMCSATFTGSFPEFHNHVTNHFADEDERDVSNTFEML